MTYFRAAIENNGIRANAMGSQLLMSVSQDETSWEQLWVAGTLGSPAAREQLWVAGTPGSPAVGALDQSTSPLKTLDHAPVKCLTQTGLRSPGSPTSVSSWGQIVIALTGAAGAACSASYKKMREEFPFSRVCMKRYWRNFFLIFLWF